MARRRVKSIADSPVPEHFDVTRLRALAGIGDLIPFMKHAEQLGVWFTLEHQRADAVTVILHLVGLRIEATFFPHDVEFVLYKGNEEMHDDQEALFRMIDEAA